MPERGKPIVAAQFQLVFIGLISDHFEIKGLKGEDLTPGGTSSRNIIDAPLIAIWSQSRIGTPRRVR
jgi:hypothetical protein